MGRGTPSLGDKWVLKMAGRQIPIPMARSKSRIALYGVSLVCLSFLLLLFSLSPSSSSYSHLQLQVLNVETSFVASLEHFLTHSYRAPSLPDDDTVAGGLGSEEDVRKLDDGVYRTEMDRLYRDPYYPVSLPIRVYVYNMPTKFTYDLLWLFRNSYKDTSNLTSNGSPVHRLIEQHSVDYWLWADLIGPESERLLKSVVRVHRQEEADLFYIPFFTTISFFLMEKQQCKALYRVKL